MTELDLKTLADQVRHELEEYEIPERHPDLVGRALPQSWYDENLANMRNGLVEPYLAEVDCYTSVSDEEGVRQLAIVARDGHGNFLAYDPIPDLGDFAMVGTENEKLRLYNIRGNAVDTFLSF